MVIGFFRLVAADAGELAVDVGVDNGVDGLVGVNAEDARADAVDARVVSVDARAVAAAGRNDAADMCGK